MLAPMLAKILLVLAKAKAIRVRPRIPINASINAFSMAKAIRVRPSRRVRYPYPLDVTPFIVRVR